MEKKNKFLFQVIKLILEVLFIILFQPKVVNKHYMPSKGAAILASNHVNAIDPCLTSLVTRRSITYLAKKEVFEGKFGWFFKATGCLPVDRQNGAHETTLKAISILKQQEVVGIFPEGTRNKTNEILQPFKMGAIKMAKETNSLIVPCAILGKARPFGGYKIVVGKPIDVSSMSYQQANDYLFNTIKQLIIDNGGK